MYSKIYNSIKLVLYQSWISPGGPLKKWRKSKSFVIRVKKSCVWQNAGFSTLFCRFHRKMRAAATIAKITTCWREPAEWPRSSRFSFSSPTKWCVFEMCLPSDLIFPGDETNSCIRRGEKNRINLRALGTGGVYDCSVLSRVWKYNDE